MPGNVKKDALREKMKLEEAGFLNAMGPPNHSWIDIKSDESYYLKRKSIFQDAFR